LSKARDFLDVRDVVAAYLALIAASDKFRDRVSVFNVASGQAHTIKSLLDGLRSRAKRAFEVVVDERLLRPANTDLQCVASHAEALRAVTGWAPRHSIDDMLQSLLDYWREVESTRG
jgi:GDP-4-dehydro-6-deoxy-D-mannose reductase